MYVLLGSEQWEFLILRELNMPYVVEESVGQRICETSGEVMTRVCTSEQKSNLCVGKDKWGSLVTSRRSHPFDSIYHHIRRPGDQATRRPDHRAYIQISGMSSFV